ncbi:ABC transporter substrate-binding protein [Halomicrococcus gelatinilyticus]|uniref:ABC transporter substrate-binding protein n=1 Tax=Halomicrococcus gelatinilyticus TaxID=1702103 RepID=UPI002E112601
MVERSSDDATRRRFLKGSAVAGAALLAGCSGDTSDGDTTTGETTSDRTTSNGTSSDETTTTTDGPYSVTMPPVGKVTFESVPGRWVAENPSWADMGVALGLEQPLAVVLTSEYRTHQYDDIPGISVNTDEMTSLWQDGISKELFYKLGADVHFIDPNYMTKLIPNWDQSDVDEIATNVAPMCGNTSFSTYPWHEDYPYYDLYEAFEKVAKVFRRRDRYVAFKQYHDEFIGNVTERLPDERPSIALLSPASTQPEKFYPYRLGERTAYKHWHDLGVTDALAGSNIATFTSDRGTIDFEPLLEIDPEVIMFYTDEHRPHEEFRSTYLEFLREHDTASALTAVQNGDVYPAGSMYQGPIMNLAKTERAAKQLFPDEFDSDERLYDRQRVAAISKGDA